MRASSCPYACPWRLPWRSPRYGRTAVFLALLAAGCTTGPLDPHGPVAAQQRLILINATLIMLAVAIPTIVAAVWFAWWFRSTNPRAKYRPNFVYSGRVELVMWAVPLLITLFLTGLIWTGSHDLDPYRPLPTSADRRTTEVQVVALDWKWLFIYPEQGVASVNELVVPAGAPVHFAMTSASVLNTFYIPQLGGMIYVMNGMVTQINLQADDPGNYYGRSAHFSGDGFSDMQFVTRALPAAQFEQWAEATRRNGRTLNRDAYADLAKQSVLARPVAFGGIDPGLFAAVTTQEVPPSAGPQTGRGGDPGIQERGQR